MIFSIKRLPDGWWMLSSRFFKFYWVGTSFRRAIGRIPHMVLGYPARSRKLTAMRQSAGLE